MNKEIKKNRELDQDLDPKMINCIKVSTYGLNLTAIYAYLVDGRRLQVSNPIFNFMLKQDEARHFVVKNFPQRIKRALKTMGGGIALVNLNNVKEFDVEACGDRQSAWICAIFKNDGVKSGTESQNTRLYTVPAYAQGNELDMVDDLLKVQPGRFEKNSDCDNDERA